MAASTSSGVRPSRASPPALNVAGPLLRRLMRPDLGGDFIRQHQALVEPARVRGKQLAQNLQRVGILVAERHRVPEDVHLRIRLRLGIHAFLGGLFDFQRDHIRRGDFAARDAGKVFLRQRRGARHVEIADQNQRDVLRRIVGGVEFIRLRLGDGGDVRRPADRSASRTDAIPRTAR